jgi:hypothetical protein
MPCKLSNIWSLKFILAHKVCSLHLVSMHLLEFIHQIKQSMAMILLMFENSLTFIVIITEASSVSEVNCYNLGYVGVKIFLCSDGEICRRCN